MSTKDNSVNIKQKPGKNAPYHHGDLRAALIESGLELLQQRNAEDIGLREVARHVGVSATAIYRHFPDKEALLVALAHEGMEKLAAIQQVAGADAGGGADGFRATGAAYVKFAVDNPALFRLMFSCAPAISLLDSELGRVGSAMRALRENIARLMPEDLPDYERKVAALRAWSIVHGLSLLVLDGQIEYDEETIYRVISGTRI
ncbi:MAG: AcrR family transcriptional regulator [Gammaproteobacteria bacterium]|jgi:AcrR family transcriptional regulator